MTAGHMAFWCVGQELQEQRIRESLRQPHQTFRAAAVTPEPWHGTANGYDAHYCRCLQCRSANATRKAQQRAAQRSKQEQEQRYYRTRKARGLCRSCPKQLSALERACGSVRCLECRSKQVESQRAYLARKGAA